MGTENGDGKKKKPFYRNVQDTLEDVGITLRQLGYWRKQGLFIPELGPSAKNFTEGDTEQLRFLKRLIEDLGLPVSTVKRLIMTATGEVIGRPHYLTYIDIETPKLVSSSEGLNQLIADAIAAGTHVDRDKWFWALALQIFRSMSWRSANAEVHQAQKKAFYEQLEQIDRMSRLRQTKSGEYFFWPQLDTDPELTVEMAQELVKAREQLEADIDEATWLRHPPF
jgi:DNA-binding transcriptional MerR regulator